MKKAFLIAMFFANQVFSNAQNVGIGTNNPTRAKLEVNGAVGATAAIFGARAVAYHCSATGQALALTNITMALAGIWQMAMPPCNFWILTAATWRWICSATAQQTVPLMVVSV